jgi:hypothetical protein
LTSTQIGSRSLQQIQALTNAQTATDKALV